MLPRTLEPEVMDTVAEAVDYDSMDHSQVNIAFVDDLLAFAASTRNQPGLRILDVGTGTALIPIELCGRDLSDCSVTAIDLAGEMLKLARRNVEQAGLTDCIVVEQVDAKQMPYADASFAAVISNSIVHHIPEPRKVLAEMIRVLQPGGVLFVRDLLRPHDAATVEQIVQTYAGEENDHQRQMFRDSLHAALTLEEIRKLLSEHGLPAEWAMQTTDRHWTIAGIIPTGGTN